MRDAVVIAAIIVDVDIIIIIVVVVVVVCFFGVISTGGIRGALMVNLPPGQGFFCNTSRAVTRRRFFYIRCFARSRWLFWR